MMSDRSWSLDLKPVYDDYEPVFDGLFTHYRGSTLRHVRVAVKYGNREVLVFHAVRPSPPSPGDNDHDFMTIRAIQRDDPSLNLNPLAQLLADAELGRKVREAGLELK